MKKILFTTALTSICLLLSCCEDEPLPLPKRDISYALDIKPMFVEHGCENCHNQKTYAAKLSLDSFDSAKAAVVKETFFPQLSPQGGSIYASMPPYTSEYVMMSDAEIEEIKSWIKQGFQK
jgi:hypothetical protein